MNEDALLELVAPRADEELVGAVLTTFVIDGRFVEEELLTTLVGLPVAQASLRGRVASCTNACWRRREA